MVKYIASLLAGIFLLITTTGCVVDINDSTQQMLASTAIQLATSAYLENNMRSAPLVVDMTDKAIAYFKEDGTLDQTTEEMKAELHAYIQGLDISRPNKIALTGLIDAVLSEAIKWAEIKVDTMLNNTYVDVFVWCAEQMNGVAVMYLEIDRDIQSKAAEKELLQSLREPQPMPNLEFMFPKEEDLPSMTEEPVEEATKLTHV